MKKLLFILPFSTSLFYTAEKKTKSELYNITKPSIPLLFSQDEYENKQKTQNEILELYTDHTLDHQKKSSNSKSLLSFIERLRKYRTYEHFSIEIKKTNTFLRKLIYDIDNDLLYNSSSMKQRLSLSFVNELLNKGRILNKGYLGLRTDTNEYIINYIYEESISILVETLSQIVSYDKKESILNNKYLFDIKEYVEYVKSNTSNSIVKFECNKLLLNINERFNSEQDFELKSYSHMILPVNSHQISKDKHKFNIIFINGLNSSVVNCWRVLEKEETAFCKTRPSKTYCKVMDYLNYVFNLNFNTQVNDELKKGIDYNISNICSIYAETNIQNKNSNPEKSEFSQKKVINLIRFRYVPYSKLWINEFLEKSNTTDKYFICRIESKIFMKDLRGLPNFTLEEVSDRLKRTIEKEDLLSKPTIFICHSMGGVIFKNMIKMGMSSEMIKGVIFFSTPHKGSSFFFDLADSVTSSLMKWLEVFNHTIVDYSLEREEVKKILNQFYITTLTKEMCFKGEDYFQDLHKRFLMKNIPHVTINESERSYIEEINDYLWVVNPDSCRIKVDDYEEYYNSIFNNEIYFKNPMLKKVNFMLPFRKHHNVQKFVGFNDNGYILFLDLFEKLKGEEKVELNIYNELYKE